MDWVRIELSKDGRVRIEWIRTEWVWMEWVELE